MKLQHKSLYIISINIIISMPRIHEQNLVPKGFYWCLKCHWAWHPRSERIPVACPDCQSRRWNGEKQP